MWWTPLARFNQTSCEVNKDHIYLKASDYKFATYEVLRLIAKYLYKAP